MIGTRNRWVVAGSAALLAAGVATFVLLDPGSSDDDASGARSTIPGAEFPFDLPSNTIGAHDRRYGPDPTGVTVSVGEAVVFENTDDVPHTFTADDGLFDSGVVEPGGRHEVMLDGPRTVAFHCDIHPEMRGEFTIE